MKQPFLKRHISLYTTMWIIYDAMYKDRTLLKIIYNGVFRNRIRIYIYIYARAIKRTTSS